MTQFETKTQMQARIQKTEAERRAQTRANFIKAKPQEATLQFVVTSEMVGPNPSKGEYGNNNVTDLGAGSPQYIVRVAPLAVEDDETSVQMQFEETLWLTLPVLNLEIEGHTVPDELVNKRAKDFIALAPERVSYVDKGTPGAWKNDPETRAATQRQKQATNDLSADLLAGEYKLTGHKFFGTVKHKNNGNGYNIKKMSATAPEGYEFTAPVEAETTSTN